MKLSGQQCQQRLTAIANVTSWDKKELRRDGQVQNKYYEGRGYTALSCLSLGAIPVIATLTRALSVNCTSTRDVRVGVASVRQMIETLKAKATSEQAQGDLRALTVKVQAAIAAYVAIENKKRDALGEEAQINVDVLLGATQENTTLDPAVLQTIGEAVQLLASSDEGEPAVVSDESDEAAPSVDVDVSEQVEGVKRGDESPEAHVPRSGSPFSFNSAAAEQVLSELEAPVEGMRLRSNRVVTRNENLSSLRFRGV